MKRAIAMFIVFLFAAGACAMEEEEAAPTPTPEETPAAQITVTLSEYSVIPTPALGAAGEITFAVTNRGADEHEFVVVSSDLDPGALPTLDDGSVDEEQVEVAGEVEELAPGASGEVALDLAAGPYVLMCNLLEEEGEPRAHYELGMRTGFTVR